MDVMPMLMPLVWTGSALCQLPGGSPVAAEGVYQVRDFGAVGDGVTDDTAAVQAAIDAAGEKGGGIVYLPPGKYLIAGSLQVGVGVAVLGANQAPLDIESLAGTVILATGGRDDEEAPPLFRMGSGSTVKGVTVYYPDQTPTDVRPYPWTFVLTGIDNTVENVTLINSYNGLYVGPEGNVRHRIRSVYGCVLRRGIFVDRCSDIGRIENVQFHCHWWSQETTGGAWNPVYEYMWRNLEAFIFGRTDWEYVTNTFVFPANIGYRFIATEHGACNGQFGGIGADAVQQCVHVDAIQPMGLLIGNGEFVAFNGDDPTAIVVSPTCAGSIRLVNCAFWGPSARLARLEGSGSVAFAECYFENSSPAPPEGPHPLLEVLAGRVQVRGCTFATPQPGVHLGPEVRHAIISENNGPAGVTVINEAGDRAIIANNEPPPAPSEMAE